MVKRKQLEIQPLVARSLRPTTLRTMRLGATRRLPHQAAQGGRARHPGGSPLKLSTDGLQRLEGLPRSATSNASR